MEKTLFPFPWPKNEKETEERQNESKQNAIDAISSNFLQSGSTHNTKKKPVRHLIIDNPFQFYSRSKLNQILIIHNKLITQQNNNKMKHTPRKIRRRRQQQVLTTATIN